MLELLMMVLPAILAMVVGYLIVNATAGYLVVKDAIRELADVTNALDNMMQCLCKALEDDAVTEEEFREIFDHTIVIWTEVQELTRKIAASGMWVLATGLIDGVLRKDYRAALIRRLPFLHQE
jgi:predicted lipoprotein